MSAIEKMRATGLEPTVTVWTISAAVWGVVSLGFAAWCWWEGPWFDALGNVTQGLHDASTWGLLGNSIAAIVLRLAQRKRALGPVGRERSHLACAYSNTCVAALCFANFMLPSPLMSLTLPPWLTAGLALGCLAAANVHHLRHTLIGRSLHV